jgi:hypothetical protein
MWGHMMEWGGGWGPGWGLFGLMHILWWILILLGVIALVRSVFGRARAVSVARKKTGHLPFCVSATRAARLTRPSSRNASATSAAK